MAISFVGAADGGHAFGVSSFSYLYTCGSGANRHLVANVLGDTASDLITGATYNGVSMVMMDKIFRTPAAVPRWMYYFYLLNPASGSNTVAITASGTCDIILSVAADYSGVAQVGQPDAEIKQLGSSGSPLTTTITTVKDNDWAILCHIGSGTAPLTGTNATLRIQDGFAGVSAIFDSGAAITPPGPYSMTTSYSPGNSPIAHIIGAFSPDIPVPDTAGTPIFRVKPPEWHW